MNKNLFKKRKFEFVETIIKLKRLPKVWEYNFTDREDQRLWFDTISKIEEYKDITKEIEVVLKQYNIKLLSDKEKEIEFLNAIKKINKIPRNGEMYFSDNSNMYMWYHNYKSKNSNFETLVHNNLKEYQEFDIATIWSDSKEEFISIIKQLKRIPKHGEVILQNDIDVRVVYDKLETFEPQLIEKILLHLQTYKHKGLSLDDRLHQIKQMVYSLGYIPYLQEARFSDGTDMFTWYLRYKEKLPNLENELNSLIYKESPHKKVNIYLIPNFRNTGGKFYTICTNIGEKLDLSQINSFEEAKKIDSTITKRGGVILKKDEEISSTSFVKGKSKK